MTGNNTLVEGGEAKVVCLRQVSSLNIAHEKVKFRQWTGLEVLFSVVVELVIFMKISFHTFQGKGDGDMYARAL